jgi:hypothetical protein
MLTAAIPERRKQFRDATSEQGPRIVSVRVT